MSSLDTINTADLEEVKRLIPLHNEATDPDQKAQYHDRIVELLAGQFSEEAKLIVADEKKSVKAQTTQDGYGYYLYILGEFKGMMREAIVKAIRDAGGNSQGINSALMLLHPNSY